MHKWEQDRPRTQNVLSGEPRPLVAIRVTSLPEHPRPWFAVCEPPRQVFVEETIAMLFGYQPDGERHTWEQLAIVPAADSRPETPDFL